jgi:two-component sensor histidine kinase
MRRITELDFPDRMRPAMPGALSQLLFAVICSLLGIGLRLLLDLWVPDIGAFVVMFPAVLVATLFGRWQAGVLTQLFTTLYGWYFVLPVQGSFMFAHPEDQARTILATVFGLMVIGLAELFRRAVREALADRETLLRELDHRVKNNFAAMAALLEMQLKRTESLETRTALQAALGRIESFSRAHQFLYHQDFDGIGAVNMRSYLSELCGVLGSAIGLGGSVQIRVDAEPVLLPHDRAIAIGMLVNEVATNSAKHAFPDRDQGKICVAFAEGRDGYQLEVRDDGCGMPDERRSGSLGLTLIDALTRQAGATVEMQTGIDGTAYSFAIAR